MATPSFYSDDAAVPELSAIEWAGLEHELYCVHNKRVVALLGEGGFGRAYHVLDKTGADKVVKLDTTHNGSLLAEEYAKMDWLRHPNIPRLYDFLSFNEGAITGYEMDFYQSGDLFRFIEAASQGAGHITDMEMFNWFKDVLSALSHVHALHVVHRDVKPHNILFDHGMKALLADFGLATCPSVTYAEHKDRAGTVGFMAPEMMAGLAYSTPVDVWSFNRVVNATATADPRGTKDMEEHSVRLWLWSLHKSSGSTLPFRRFSAAALYSSVTLAMAAGGDSAAGQDAICATDAEDMDYERMHVASKPTENARRRCVNVSAAFRALGPTERMMMKQGRAAEKRIASSHDGTRAPAEAIRARNALRKKRRKVGRAVARTSADIVDCRVEDVVEYLQGEPRACACS